MLPNEHQAGFSAAIWSRDADIPTGVNPAVRFAIHRNNVYAGLLASLQTRYPVTRRLLGEDCFRGCAFRFVDAWPPRSPILMEYGERFPNFIALQDDLRYLAYLHDVARLEWLQHAALHGAEAEPIQSSALASLPPERMGNLVLALHPTAHVLRSPYPVLSIWQANAGVGSSGIVPADRAGEDVLIVRPREAVLLIPLAPGAAAFVLAIGRGASLTDASSAANLDNSDFDLTRTLASLLRHEVFVDYSLANRTGQ